MKKKYRTMTDIEFIAIYNKKNRGCGVSEYLELNDELLRRLEKHIEDIAKEKEKSDATND